MWDHGLFKCDTWVPECVGSRAHRLSSSAPCGILDPDQGSNLQPCTARLILNHWTTREVPLTTLYKDSCPPLFLSLPPPPSLFSRVQLCAIPWTAAYQAPPSMGFSRQEHWSGLPFPSPMRESEVTQSCLTLSDPMDCSLPDSSIHGIFRATVLEWGAIAFSISITRAHFFPSQT